LSMPPFSTPPIESRTTGPSPTWVLGFWQNYIETCIFMSESTVRFRVVCPLGPKAPFNFGLELWYHSLWFQAVSTSRPKAPPTLA
jgi:hypothetical protein